MASLLVWVTLHLISAIDLEGEDSSGFVMITTGVITSVDSCLVSFKLKGQVAVQELSGKQGSGQTIAANNFRSPSGITDQP